MVTKPVECFMSLIIVGSSYTEYYANFKSKSGFKNTFINKYVVFGDMFDGDDPICIQSFVFLYNSLFEDLYSCTMPFVN